MSRRATPSALVSAAPRFDFFGGKGGVGKTTCAAAFALRAAHAGERVLVLSTDPAHSLGDALDLDLGPAPKKVRLGRAIVEAAELDAPSALERWLSPKRGTLRTIAERGTYLDRDDIERFLNLSLPGVDELIALLEVVRLAGEHRYQRVVVDTAPTGHTLRLLRMPRTLHALAGVLNDMQAKHRAIEEAIRGRHRDDAADALIAELIRQSAELEKLLSDRGRTELHWVLLPEALSVSETLSSVQALRADGLAVSELIVNRVLQAPLRPCGLCSVRRRRERVAIAAVLEGFEKSRVRFVAARDLEPVGARALTAFGRALAASDKGKKLARGTPGHAPRERRPRASSEPFALEVPGSLQLLLFGGKGGVGKTTCSAAAALTLARIDPRRSVLLLSADPARRMGDVLGASLSDSDQAIPSGPSNLRVRELDADASFARERERYRRSVDELFDALRGHSHFDVAYDRAVVRDLIDLAPPGLDELFALFSVVDALFPALRAPLEPKASRAQPPVYDLVVVDTAPTGHALRLLDAAPLALDWTHVLLEVLLKYQRVVGLGQLARDLVHLAHQLRQLHALLGDPARSRFVVVSRAARLPRVESRRLMDALDARNVARGELLVNALTPEDGCARCRARSKAERAEVSALLEPNGRRRSRLRGQNPTAILAPALRTPPRGVEALESFAQRWIRS